MTYKNFEPGDILTAADADLLMRQGVIVVANAAARDAIEAPSEGMQVYRLDTHKIERHDGAGWIDPDDSGEIALTSSNANISSTASYRRTRGQVSIYGVVGRVGGTSWPTGAGEAFHTLPAGFRPPGEVRLPILSATGAAITHALFVATNGVVSMAAVAGSVTAAARIPPITFQVA